jgi:uncharacterized protein
MPAEGREAQVGPSRKRHKGPRPKRIPQRMCISCRERSAKRTLIRIVRTPDGAVQIDPSGKMNGRGAYLCDDPACWHRALSGEALARALKTELSAETIERLSQFATALPPISPEQSGGEAQQGGSE